MWGLSSQLINFGGTQDPRLKNPGSLLRYDTDYSPGLFPPARKLHRKFQRHFHQPLERAVCLDFSQELALGEGDQECPEWHREEQWAGCRWESEPCSWHLR